MNGMTEQELKSELKLGKFRRLYFIFGEDGYYKNHYAKEIAKQSASVMPEMNFIKLDGTTVSMQKLYDETEQLPCMAEYRAILLNDFDFAKAKADEKEDFINIISDIPDSTVLIVLCDTIEINQKKPGEWSKVIRIANSNGAVLNFEHLTVPQLKNVMIKAAEKRKCMLDLSTANYLVETAGRDFATLKGEIEKLCMYCKNGRITREDVDRICTKSVEANIFNLSNFIISGNLAGALQTIGNLIDMRVDPIIISSQMISGFCDVYRAKAISGANVSVNDAAKELGYGKREFVISRAVAQSKQINRATLNKCLDILSDTDIRLKSTADDKRYLLEQTVIMLVRTVKSKK